jgi:hypothetical protein
MPLYAGNLCVGSPVHWKGDRPMPRVSKLVVGSLLAFGPLVVVVGRWPDIADSWKSFTVVGTVAWEALLGVGWLFVKIAAVPAVGARLPALHGGQGTGDGG